ncbi:hypothetical protein ACFQX7_18700 [Luedemannella flava]
MTADQKLSAVGVAVGVVAIVVGVLAARRWGTRRRRLFLTYTSASLMPSKSFSGIAKNVLKVTFQDVVVDDPYVTIVVLENGGPADAASAHFHDGEPFYVELNCTLLDVMNSSHPDYTIVRVDEGRSAVGLRPCLFRKGDSWNFVAVTDGKPKLSAINSLVDTDVSTSDGFPYQPARWLLKFAASLTPPAGFHTR